MSDGFKEVAETAAQYFWLICVAGIGGLANYITKLRQNKQKTFSIVELAGELLVSGFVGLITALVCIDRGFSLELTYAAAGIAGHLGTRGLYLLEQRALDWLEKMTK